MTEDLVLICKSEEIQEGKAIKHKFEEEDFEVAIFRINNKLYCISNECPHNHERRIFEGFVENLRVKCPLHGWTYSLETGKNIKGGASLKTFFVSEENGDVFIEKPTIDKPKWML